MDYRKKFFVDPAEKLRLRKLDPSYKGDHESEEAAKQETEHYRVKLAHQQALLYAQRKHSVLVVLQALDAGGKDGTVNHVFSALNPQGATVIGFKQPTPVELAHDFLWRVHPRAPGRGEVAIFNRSHYEDVLVTRVHKLIDKATWTARYKRIRQFETGLADNGTTILKFFLNISKEDQLARFAERLEDPKRNWKISESDYTERALWDDYIAAFEDAINATSSREAPWYIIPASHKWFRNLAVSQIMADTMEALDMIEALAMTIPPRGSAHRHRRRVHRGDPGARALCRRARPRRRAGQAGRDGQGRSARAHQAGDHDPYRRRCR
jgi:PPK2 family polyphosphate:nucleotide phosphotransferase